MAPVQPGRSVCETEPDQANLAGAAPGFRWMVLQRHGKRPLAVLGRALLQANNRCAGLPWWSEITIHETAASHFAASIRHTPNSAGEPVWCDAWVCDSAEAVRKLVHAHDPLWALPPQANDPASIIRFSRAWAGLIAAVFGLSSVPRSAA
jgi:hypothetical protein